MNKQEVFFENGAIPGYIYRSLDGKSILAATEINVDENSLVEASDKESATILNPGDICRHVKTQGDYVVLYWAKTEKKEIPVVVYQSLKDRKLWVRHRSSMFDGRFQRI